MPSEPPAEAPPSTSKGAENLESVAKPAAEVEYDDFGLPIRKRRPRTPVVDSSDSEEDKFEDAVATKTASQEKLAPSTEEKISGANAEHVEQKGVQEVPEVPEVPEAVAKIIEQENNAHPPVNGHMDESRPPPEPASEPKMESRQSEHVENKGAEQVESSKTENVENEKAEHTEDIKTPKAEDNESEKVESDKTTPVEKDLSDTSQQSEPAKKDVTVGPVPKHRQQASLASISEYSHQRSLMKPKEVVKEDDGGEWQEMPSYAHYDMYDDDNKLIAKENAEELVDMSGYANVGGAAKGYTRVDMDDDADSQTSLDDNTAYLFKEKSTALADEDGEVRDAQSQMQATKSLLTEGQRVAYVGLVRLASIELERKFARIERNKRVKKILDMQTETTRMWSQKVMVRLYEHMEITTSEQIMIEQLSDHGVVPADLTPTLMTTIPIKDFPDTPGIYSPSVFSPRSESMPEKQPFPNSPALNSPAPNTPFNLQSPPPYGFQSPPPYQEEPGSDYQNMKSPSQFSQFSARNRNLDIDLRWTVLCDLFLVLIADAVYDSRSRELFEVVGKYLSVDWLEICRFEKRVTDALEMQEQADKENWNEDDHMTSRAKRARNKRLAFMGLATVGGGLVIGLSAGLLAPLIGAGLAAGFTTIGVAGTSSFLAGAGGAAIITSTGVVTGGTVGVRAMNRRTGSVKTFEYRPLHNNKRTHLIITLAGWMNGKVDDVRLPYSTVDPIMGDIYSVLWEPEMLRSMGDTINILATEALTQGLQQVLGSTILAALMAAMTLPLALTKLSYLIDNPWIVSQARADMAGLILADSLIDRNLGTRPVTLVGFSLGSRVIFSCLKELAKRAAFGVVQNVYMFGTPAVAKHDEYTKARAIVPGRFVNGYATNDWILGYLFRATSGGVMRVAGLAPVQIPTIENVNVTELVPGHMAYRAAMPKLLREVGWIVESDEFTEIEDPDPEDHEKRQRELINEIEEARKELEKQAVEKEKKGGKLSWWRKKKADKKDWEVYDEHTLAPPKPIDQDADPAKIAENPVMFDIDAIRKEVAALAAESKEYNAETEFEIKEIQSTLPPMKIDIGSSPASSPCMNLRETKSYNDSLGVATTPDSQPGNSVHLSSTNESNKPRYEEYDEFDDLGAGHVEMTFDSSFRDPPTPAPASASKSPLSTFNPTPERSPSPWRSSTNDNNSLRPWDSTPSKPSAARNSTSNDPLSSPGDRPPIKSVHTAPYPSSSATSNDTEVNPGYNAWADEFDDDFGQEKEVKMSFM